MLLSLLLMLSLYENLVLRLSALQVALVLPQYQTRGYLIAQVPEILPQIFSGACSCLIVSQFDTIVKRSVELGKHSDPVITVDGPEHFALDDRIWKGQ